MKRNTWFAIGLGLGIAAAGVLILKKTGLLGGGDCDYEDDMCDEYYDSEKDCVITPAEEAADNPSEESATEEISGEEKPIPILPDNGFKIMSS
jgi:hypothetical protein